MKPPVFRSPLVMRDHAKQPLYTAVTLIPFLFFEGFAVYKALLPFSVFPIFEALVMSVLAVWHVTLVRTKALHDVTAFLPSLLALCAARILFKIPAYLLGLAEGFTFRGLVLLFCEIVFWAAFGYCTVRAVCGKYKLIVPMLFLFFGFFYTFIKYDLHAFGSIGAQICLFLLLWFPIDGIGFTTYLERKKEEAEKQRNER